MLSPRLAPTVFSSGLGLLPRHQLCIPPLLNCKHAGPIARGHPDIKFHNGAVRASSSSSTRWKTRQGRDAFSREAKVQGLKSRAAFKLLEIDVKYKIFKRGQTVVDLGYAPGSWSQVAVERTKPGGRILGIDIIPAQPPKGVSTIQGNFLSAGVQESVKQFLSDPDRGRPRRSLFADDAEDIEPELSYLELERHMDDSAATAADHSGKKGSRPAEEQDEGKMVDVVLSDMMMNTTGIKFSDHAGSMDLCAAALRFAFDTLKPGGHFVCKFYQGAEDKQLELQLKKLFSVVHREKPESSRSESKESFFVALSRKTEVDGVALGYVDDVKG
ncbi:c00b3d5e-99cf-4265-8bf1-8b25775ab3dc [Sclerotinia trifoliorum]|uniref:rRNA methyltransferase 2, mitochondrial n=1 Tax=Sclerotinia trifoliorum TaxID=28548 RepID=A0A8H2W4X1_9HELO|nr:c00b3d5e-99cf-4265-8bf1-8b25775ab3dc [Sclerotinia trifoliorum]